MGIASIKPNPTMLPNAVAHNVVGIFAGAIHPPHNEAGIFEVSSKNQQTSEIGVDKR